MVVEIAIDSGQNIRGIQITYNGNVKIHDKTPDGFYIAVGKRKIVIFPLGDGALSDLFEYEGNFKIIKLIVSDDSGEKVSTNITKVMDYSELLGVSESITTNSEDLKETYTSKKKVKKSSVIGSNIIDNQHTSKFETLYLADGNVYEGNLHIHLDGSIMTGEKHSETAEDLYFKRNKMLISNRIFARQKPVEPRKRIRKIKTRSNY